MGYRRFPIKEALISLFSHASGIVDLWGVFKALSLFFKAVIICSKNKSDEFLS
jgi:hypothetical protein